MLVLFCGGFLFLIFVVISFGVCCNTICHPNTICFPGDKLCSHAYSICHPGKGDKYVATVSFLFVLFFELEYQ